LMLKRLIIITLSCIIATAVHHAAHADALWASINGNELHVALSEKPGDAGIDTGQVQKSIVTTGDKTLTLNQQDGKFYLTATLPLNTNLVGVSNEWGNLDNPEPNGAKYQLHYYAKAARTLADAANPTSQPAQWYAVRTLGADSMTVRLVERGQPVVGANVKLFESGYSGSVFGRGTKTNDKGEITFWVGDKKSFFGLEADWYNPGWTWHDQVHPGVHQCATMTFPVNSSILKGDITGWHNTLDEDIAQSFHSHAFAIRFSADSNKLITAGIITKATTIDGWTQVLNIATDKRLRVWDVATGKEICRLPAKPKFLPFSGVNASWELWSMKDATGNTLIMPDFKTMYTSGDGGYNIFGIHSFHIVGHLNIDHNRSSIKLSPNGKLLAVGATRNAYVFDVKTHKMLRDFGNEGQGTQVFWGPHSKTLLCTWGGWYGPQAFDLETNKQIYYPRWVYRVWGSDAFAFSPDGSYLAKATGSTIEIWETPTAASAGKKLNTFATSIDIVRVLQFSPDGKTLAVGGSSKTQVPVQFLRLSQVRK
jgi:hypothetical protein